MSGVWIERLVSHKISFGGRKGGEKGAIFHQLKNLLELL